MNLWEKHRRNKKLKESKPKHGKKKTQKEINSKIIIIEQNGNKRVVEGCNED